MVLIHHVQVHQYNNFTIKHNGTPIGLVDNQRSFDNCASKNTTKCLCECAAEDIADNAGVKLAYRTFQRLQEQNKNACVEGLPFNANHLFWVGSRILDIDLLFSCPGWICHGLV